ncbi:ATP-grasp domain-containing protein [Streptomyces sp. NPDC054956]
MTGQVILLLEAAGPEAGHIIRAAAASGHQVHAVTTKAAHAGYPPELRGLLAGVLLTDFAEPGRALADVVTYARRTGAAAVLTVNEYLTELAAHACAALGLPGNDSVLAPAARNKVAMAAAFTRAGVTAPRTDTTSTLSGFQQLLAARLGPDSSVVVKPADAAGSAGVTVLTSLQGAAQAWEAARAPAAMYGIRRDERVVVQQYVAGAEYSVESLTQHGRTTHLAITAKTTTLGAHRAEAGHALPAELPGPLTAAIQAEAARAIEAVGIRNGASHTEIIVTAAGRPYVIEIGARLGAGHIGELIHHALGIDPWNALLDTALGWRTSPAATRSGYATVRFLTSPASGRLQHIAGLPQPAPGVPTVRVRARPGDLVGPLATNAGRLGAVVVTGTDRAEVEARADRLTALIRINIAP